MFVLTCPSCSHAARVKYARYNALATCPACSVRFRVDADTVSVDREGSVAGPLHNLRQERPTPRTLSVRGGSSPAAFARREESDELTTEDLWDDLFGEAPAPPANVHEAPLDWKPRQRGIFLPATLPTGAAMTLMAASAIAGALMMGLLPGGDPANESREIAGGPSPTVADEQEQQGGGNRNRSGEQEREPGEREPGPEPSEPESPPPDPAPSAPDGNRSTTAQINGLRESESRAPDLPRMQLHHSIAYEPKWVPLREPRRPMYPTTGSDVLLWMPRLQRDEQSGRTMFTAMFLADTQQVYQSGFLHVQLLDDRGQAIAELKQVVPALHGRQGLQVRLMVPEDLDERSSRVVAQFTPVDPVARAAPIEAVEGQTRVHQYTGEPPVVELTITNPNAEPVSDPTVVVELLTADGWPVGMYRGTVPGTIEPGGALTFVMRPPLDDDAEPGRVQIRGYAFKDN